MTALRLVDSAAAPVNGARAAALLGDAPTLSFVADAASPDACCTVRMVRVAGDGEARWVGVVDDHSVFTEGVRMGMTPRFVAGDARVHAVVGTARARLLGRFADVAADVRRALLPVVGPWSTVDALVVEIRPEGLAVVDDEAAGGPVPQT
jgi:hypothetical protein